MSPVLDYEIINPTYNDPPIFLLHTIPLDRKYLLESIQQVDIPFKIISLSYRDHGLSDSSSRGRDINLGNFAKDIETLRKQLGYEKIVIYAHGLGSFVALKYILWNHKRVAGLIISSGANDSSYRVKLAWNIRDKFSNQTKNMLDLYFQDTSENALDIKFRQSFAMYFDPPDFTKGAYLIDSADKMGYQAYAHLGKELESFNMRRLGRKYKGPTLLLIGEKDVWPSATIVELKRDFPRSRQLMLKDLGHFGMIENPEKYWNIVFNWVKEEVM